MNKKLYVGGLAYAVTDDGLRTLFESIGNVESAKIITDYQTGRSKGFGFVEMATPEDAAKAIQTLHGTTHEGRTIVVSEAKPPESGRGGGAGRPPRSGGGGKFSDRFSSGNKHGGGGSRDRY